VKRFLFLTSICCASSVFATHDDTSGLGLVEGGFINLRTDIKLRQISICGSHIILSLGKEMYDVYALRSDAVGFFVLSNEIEKLGHYASPYVGELPLDH